ncbi:prolyl oligopeptidase family serine peptidase [Robertmurraya korlensis]|uniref:prolyl oligopeptidase family serine peptidase n=1 Tax=Robertmurraya korlensis TaxID=519977 RepID=UPI00203B715B|nr:prolyl oligopeptidase family serine peptidase [Robertmurraya korlensis]MCM3601322.1 prolyl oligopeptidase family serine peptidase [Robertmurraya korlensis]
MKKSVLLIIIIAITNLTTCSSYAENNNGIRTIPTKKSAYNGVHLLANIVYAKTEVKPLHMHILLPKQKSRPRPLIVFIKGGGWGFHHPQKTFEFIPQLVMFAKNGYVVASIEHRTSHEGKFPTQLYDVKNAIRYLRAHATQYNINPNRIGVWGNSSGGHLAALLGTTGEIRELDGDGEYSNESSSVQAVVDWYGPTDMLQMSKYPADVDFDSPDSPESVLIGGALQENKDKVKRANPITYITKDDPPFLIMHGDKDRRVPYNQSVLLFEALKKANVEATMVKIKGAGHGGFSQPEILKTVQQFFDNHLKR